MKTSHHMSVSIDGAIRRAESGKAGKREVLALFDRADWSNLKVELLHMKSTGLEVVPFDDCDSRDKGGHCLGHPMPDEGTPHAN